MNHIIISRSTIILGGLLLASCNKHNDNLDDNPSQQQQVTGQAQARKLKKEARTLYLEVQEQAKQGGVGDTKCWKQRRLVLEAEFDRLFEAYINDCPYTHEQRKDLDGIPSLISAAEAYLCGIRAWGYLIRAESELKDFQQASQAQPVRLPEMKPGIVGYKAAILAEPLNAQIAQLDAKNLASEARSISILLQDAESELEGMLYHHHTVGHPERNLPEQTKREFDLLKQRIKTLRNEAPQVTK